MSIRTMPVQRRVAPERLIFAMLLLPCSILAQTPSPAPSVSTPPLSLHDRANAMLNDALADKNPDTRKEAVQALSLASLREPYLGEVKSALDDKDVEVRLAAITSLVDLKDKNTV